MAKIVKTKSGKYHTRVYIGTDANGKKKWKSLTHPDRKTLKRIASEYEDSHREYVESFSFLECANSYIEGKKPVLSPYTVQNYKDTLYLLQKNYPTFCALTTDSINTQHIQPVINDLVNKGKSPKYIRNIYGLISAVLKSSGCKLPDVTLPEKKRPDLYEPTTDDIKQVIDASEGTALEIPILLGVYGLRRGEICALKYPDDFNGNIVHIRHSEVYLGKDNRFLKTPKNEQSDRFISLSPDIIEKIENKGYIVKCTPKTLTTSFRKFLVRKNLPIFRFHDLRHYFASYMHSQGLSDAEIMALGGWKTDHVMKNVYRYAIAGETDKKMNDAMQKLF